MSYDLEFKLALERIKIFSALNEENYFKSFEASLQKILKLKKELLEFDEKYIDKSVTKYIKKENLWLLCVDQRDHKLGRLVYDLGLNKREEKEIGYIDANETALAFVFRTKNTSLTLDFIKTLHYLCCCEVHYDHDVMRSLNDHEKIQQPIKLGGRFSLTKETTSKMGLEEMSSWNFIKVQGGNQALNKENSDEYLNLIEEAHPVIVSAQDDIDIEKTIKDSILECENSMKQAQNKDDRCVTIAKFAKKLNCLHPFYDGNIRMVRLLILKLLMENNLSLTCLNNPNDLDGKSTKEIALEIQKGMQVYEDYIPESRPELELKSLRCC